MSSAGRHLRARARPHSRKIPKKSARASTVFASICATQFKKKSTESVRGSSRRRNQIPSYEQMQIQISRRSRRAAHVPGNHGHAQVK
jgi:hypothetical protein